MLMDIKNTTSDVPGRQPEKAVSARLSAKNSLFGEDGLNFRDIIDLINPLQHIPIVGRIYRAITNDDIAPGIRVAGGSLFGGPMGAAFAAAGLAIDKAGGVLSDKIASGKMSSIDNKKESIPYSLDSVIASRRRPLNLQVFNPTSKFSNPSQGSKVGADSKNDWPYALRQSHMPFIKISQLIEENYRFLEDESKIKDSRKNVFGRIDRRL